MTWRLISVSLLVQVAEQVAVQVAEQVAVQVAPLQEQVQELQLGKGGFGIRATPRTDFGRFRTSAIGFGVIWPIRRGRF